MNRRGFTLLEMTVTVAIMTTVMGVLFTLILGLGDLSRLQQAKTTAHDEGRKAIQIVARDIRQGARSTMLNLPGPVLSYRIALDKDANGAAVDVGCNLELSDDLHTITRDYEDINADGFAEEQLVMIVGNTVEVLANGLAPEEPGGGEGEGEGELEPIRGVWFEPWGGRGVRVILQTQRLSRRGHIIMADLREIIVPRN